MQRRRRHGGVIEAGVDRIIEAHLPLMVWPGLAIALVAAVLNRAFDRD